MLLGECRSKCEHLKGVPLRPDTAEALHKVYLAKGAHGSAAIEGNTLTEQEVQEHIEGRLSVPPSREYLKTEVSNILALCNQIAETVLGDGYSTLTLERIYDFNRGVLQSLEVPEHVVPGEIPAQDIGVAGYRGAPRAECDQLMQKLLDWIAADWSGADQDGNRTLDLASEGILKAVLAHLYFVWIHPFGDGNGRTARLIEVQLLLESGLPMPAAQLLSNHYNLTRDRYYRELKRASASGGDVMPFLLYAVEGLCDGLREQLRFVQNQQLDVTWRNFVHDQFPKTTPAANRQRKLVLDLSNHYPEPIPRASITKVSPRVAELYAKKGERTLTRDINKLLSMGLIIREPGGYRARAEIISAFLPAHVEA